MNCLLYVYPALSSVMPQSMLYPFCVAVGVQFRVQYTTPGLEGAWNGLVYVIPGGLVSDKDVTLDNKVRNYDN